MLEPNIQWQIKSGKLIPIVSFDLVRPVGFSAAEFVLIESHFQTLNLLARYKDQAHTEFLALRDAALARESKTVDVLRQFLNQYLKRREVTLGPLNWRLALFRNLSSISLFFKIAYSHK